MRTHNLVFTLGVAILTAGCAAVPNFAQSQYPQNPPPPQYPQTQQYPPPQYPQGQYPPQQGQYPAPQNQYPPAQSQYPPPQYSQPPLLPPQQLDSVVQPIALYPDGLLAQVLTASTFSNEIPDAAGWANAHAYLRGEALARAIQDDNLPWDPSVLALLPFPSVLNYMAQYMSWTQELGNAVLAQRGDVMDAVQRMRQEAYNYGYLQSGPYSRVVVAGPGEIEIVPVTPGYYYVPYYNPRVVFVRPRPGFYVGGAIRFGPGITIGAAFAPWGWGGIGFGWRQHEILVDHRNWDRNWNNRRAYVTPYPYRHPEGPRVEHHEEHHEAHAGGDHGDHHDHDRH
jgi:hypothetical protein